jgi:hypothetical protein
MSEIIQINQKNQSGGRGGRRAGAGRKVGLLTTKTREIANILMEKGETPLEFMMKLMRDDKQNSAVRFEAAKAAAPYMHPKLAAVEHSGPDGKDLNPPVIQFIQDANQA